MVYPFDGIQLGKENKWTIDRRSNMGRPQKHHAKWTKKGTKHYTLPGSSYGVPREIKLSYGDISKPGVAWLGVGQGARTVHTGHVGPAQEGGWEVLLAVLVDVGVPICHTPSPCCSDRWTLCFNEVDYKKAKEQKNNQMGTLMTLFLSFGQCDVSTLLNEFWFSSRMCFLKVSALFPWEDTGWVYDVGYTRRGTEQLFGISQKQQGEKQALSAGPNPRACARESK